ncbi:ABC1 kinase family protein [Nocardia goodfellowii]|uniref:Ubiquinone biosynthesis protein n=1 Tax=Nocardia goodfellowii TaxID=882446 RepID=A0ABS4QIP6_9NOCA|nr:AarF/UbiB family protein [Nocardia goodfellowii]MBP2191565.1 ubiquinone biosynthesis protein [Nocardia goodfellowii]
MLATVVKCLIGDNLADDQDADIAFAAPQSVRLDGPDPAFSRAQLRARTLRQALEGLGPFYIKIGQILSTRPDLVSAATTIELAKLHDQVAAAPFAQFETILDQELRSPWRGYFRDIDIEQPLGSASLAQVYRVTLPNGSPAVVKIQRPGIRPVVLNDMKTLRRVAKLAGRCAPRFNAVVDLDAMLHVVFDAMEAELDFTLEAQNMDNGRRAARGFKHLSVPRVVEASPRMMVQTLAPGMSIADVDRGAFSKKERKNIGRDLLTFMYKSYFVDNVFHADPHPGNIFVHPGEKASLIDWGMVGRIDRHIALMLVFILISVAQNDARATARAWIEMGHATPWADTHGFYSDLSILVPKISTATLEELNFGVTLSTLLANSTHRGIFTQPHISLLGKSFANVEGSVRYLAPELSMVEVFEDALTDIVIDLLTGFFSDKQSARMALDLMLGSEVALEHMRKFMTDLTERDFTVRVGFLNSKQLTTCHGVGANKIALVALGAAVGALWSRRRPS